MGSVAILAKQAGFKVTGSDQAIYPPMSDVLASAGVSFFHGFSGGNLPEDQSPVVVGNAISRGNPELETALNSHRHLISLPEFIKENFIRGCTSLVITGTHGKTTTTSMAAHIFEQAGLAPGFLIAGAPGNFVSGAQAGAGKFFITEGDEYDTAFFDKRSKFLHYLPDMVVINNLEFDHADIFDSLDAIKKSFRQLVNLLPSQGVVLVNADDDNALEVSEKAFCPRLTFGASAAADYRFSDVLGDGEGCRFTVHPPKVPPFEVTLPTVGEHNVRNALAAVVLALQNGIAPEVITRAFSTFIPVRRRLEKKGRGDGITIYDDFAHHPTAISLTLNAIKQIYPSQRLIAAIEPRSNTMVRNFFQQQLVKALSLANIVFCSDLHRKQQIHPNERLNLDLLAKELHENGQAMYVYPGVDELLNGMLGKLQTGDVVVVMSNGGFGGLAGKLLAQLKGREVQGF